MAILKIWSQTLLKSIMPFILTAKENYLKFHDRIGERPLLFTNWTRFIRLISIGKMTSPLPKMITNSFINESNHIRRDYAPIGIFPDTFGLRNATILTCRSRVRKLMWQCLRQL